LPDLDFGNLDLDLPTPRAAAPGTPAPLAPLAPPSPPAAPAVGRTPVLSVPVAAVRTAKSEDARLTPAARPRAGKPRPSDPLGIMYEPPSDPPATSSSSPPLPSLDDLELAIPSLPKEPEGLEFDLDLPAARATRDDTTQKTKRTTLDSYGDLDLPAAKSPVPPKSDNAFGNLDLPMPNAKTGFDDLDLPTPKGESIDLPVSMKSLDLPVPRRPVREQKVSGSVPAVFGDSPAEPTLDLPKPRALPQPSAEAARGEKPGAGSASFGELDLGGADDMEFGDIPQVAVDSKPPAQSPRLSLDDSALRENANVGDIASATAPAQAHARVQGGRLDPKNAPTVTKKKGKGVAIFASVLLVLVLLGVGAGFATNYGFFGMYLIEGFTPAAGASEAARREIARAERRAVSDTFQDVRASLAMLGSARRQMGLNRELLARSVVHEGLYQARFGTDATSSVRISQILARIDERGGDAPGIELARAADALARNALDQANVLVSQARARSANDPYVGLVAGEIAMRRAKFDDAVAAFRSSVSHQGGARAQWGLARALVALHSNDALGEVESTLAMSPNHAGARIAKAQLVVTSHDIVAAVALLREVDGLRASMPERADAYAALGHIFESAGRVGDAHQAYAAALGLASSRIDVLLGDGRVLLAQEHYADALARFESVLADPHSSNMQDGERSATAAANLGAAQAMLKLDRARDARAKLAELVAASPNDMEILLALGRAEGELRNFAEAERQFREVIRLSPQQFVGYLELSNLFVANGNPAEAGVILEQATHAVPETAEVRRLLGLSELARNNIQAAIDQFTIALRLDANDSGAIFGLGVAQRRSGHLEEAQAQFNRLLELEPAYPGLELERGIVFEAKGEAERAVAAFTAALLVRPNDLNLVLRLGAAQVAAGQLDAAEVSLNRVRQEMPNSAEVEHFVGRLAFARHDLREATSHFERAVSLDGTRAEYHLYLAWAALEANAYGKALEQVEAALARDPSTADAFWIRGEVRLRSGAVRDALDDLIHATALKPSRFEAFAAIADCYDQLRRRPEAIIAMRRALEGTATRGDWWYRLGRLYLDEGNRPAADEALNHALAIGDAAQPPPGWLADAHRWLAESLRIGGERATAITHYNRYLELAPQSAIDRADVTRILAELQR
jgi:tetratricopeptide (TPR) repeat protein